MYKKYYEPYEQMYKKFEVGERGPSPEASPASPTDQHGPSEELITPIPEEAATYPESGDILGPGTPEPENEAAQEAKSNPESSAVNEQDAASYIVSSPLHSLHNLNLKNLFGSFELDDLILIGLIIVLLMEDGEDIPLIVILGALLLSDFF